jgi:hypothetical protein
MDLMQMDFTEKVMPFKKSTITGKPKPTEVIPLYTVKPTASPHIVEEVKIEKKEFTGNLKELTEWFLSNFDQLPKDPYQFSQGIFSNDPGKHYRYLRENIDEGPGGARCLFGALENDLLALKEKFDGNEN